MKTKATILALGVTILAAGCDTGARVASQKPTVIVPDIDVPVGERG